MLYLFNLNFIGLGFNEVDFLISIAFLWHLNRFKNELKWWVKLLKMGLLSVFRDFSPFQGTMSV